MSNETPWERDRREASEAIERQRDERRAAASAERATLDEGYAFEADRQTQRASVLGESDFEPPEGDEDVAAYELQLEDGGERNEPKRSRMARERVRAQRASQHPGHLAKAVHTIAGLVKLEGEPGKRSYSLAVPGEGKLTIGGSRAANKVGHAWAAIRALPEGDREKLIAFMSEPARSAFEAELADRVPRPPTSGKPATSRRRRVSPADAMRASKILRGKLAATPAEHTRARATVRRFNRQSRGSK